MHMPNQISKVDNHHTTNMLPTHTKGTYFCAKNQICVCFLTHFKRRSFMHISWPLDTTRRKALQTRLPHASILFNVCKEVGFEFSLSVVLDRNVVFQYIPLFACELTRRVNPQYRLFDIFSLLILNLTCGCVLHKTSGIMDIVCWFPLVTLMVVS